MAKYNSNKKEIDMQGVDPDTIYGSSLWLHENIHRLQHKKHGWKYKLLYIIDPWGFERPAYYVQICFLLNAGIAQNRFAWLRDILEVGYKGVTPEKVEDLLNEIEI